MAWIAGAAALVGSLISADAASSAADKASAGAGNAGQTQLQMFNVTNAQQEPWRQAGSNALRTIGEMQPQFTKSFGADDLKSNLAPNYQFQLDQGLRATKNAGNLQTGLVSGNTLRGVSDYAQNYAGNAYQQAFNNYNAQQTNIFNRLSNIAGLGQTANQTSAQAGMSAANGIGNAQIAQGAAQAAGTVGAANALSGGINNALGWYKLNDLMGSPSGSGGNTVGYNYE